MDQPQFRDSTGLEFKSEFHQPRELRFFEKFYKNIADNLIFTICGVFANGYLVVIVGKHKQLRNNTGIYFIVLLTVCELFSCLGRLAQTCFNFAYVVSCFVLCYLNVQCGP